jgi:DNA primase
VSISSDFENAKERIREAIDIVNLVGQYVPLRRSGRNYVGRCPWHDDSRPSLQVNPLRQTFKCWVCDVGGDVFSFVMKAENVNFKEALEILADKTGVALPKKRKFDPKTDDRQTSVAGGEEDRTAEQTEITKKQLVQAADWLAKVYHEALLNLDEAEIARKYLKRRGIQKTEIEKFQIGYAPLETNWLVDKVQKKPTRLQILEIVGNLKKGCEDFFRGRLIFPIRDEQSRTVAFGGRLIPDSPLSRDSWHKERKYLNSPETTLFSKHKVLFGLDIARRQIKETRRALIMEGYTDCIAAHQFGFGDAVAVLGTALGPVHLRLLERMGAEKIILMLDGDKAGQTKAESDKVLTDFIAEGVDMAVLILPENLDPCEFLEQYGADALDSLLQTQTVDALEHIFRIKTRGIDLNNDIIASSKALDSILEIIAHAPLKTAPLNDPIRFRIEKTIQNLSVRFRMPEAPIRQRFKEKQQKAQSEQQKELQRTGNEKKLTAAPFSREDLPDTLEREMLELWIADPTAIYEFWEKVPAERCQSLITRAVYKKCDELLKRNKLPTFSNIIVAFDDPMMKNFLVELDESVQKKFFTKDESEAIGTLDNWDEIQESLDDENAAQQLDPKWKAETIREMIDGFDRRDDERRRIADLNLLRNNNLSDAEKNDELLRLQEKLRKQQEEIRNKLN